MNDTADGAREQESGTLIQNDVGGNPSIMLTPAMIGRHHSDARLPTCLNRGSR